MRPARTVTTGACAVCDRNLLVGERATRFAPNGDDYVDVCPLCVDIALDYGWIKEGSPTTPTVAQDRRRRSLNLAGIFGARRPASAPVVSEPILRRLSASELAVVEAAESFNASQYRRTVAGIAKSLGQPQVSIVALSGVNTEVAITIAWDISWYQYRVSFESQQPVRLEERGHEVDELDDLFKSWNTELADDGRLVPQVARV